jgi:hypothetical protein
MMRDLKRHLAGITGTSCSHGNDQWDEPIRYEACDKHHVDTAYRCVKSFLGQSEVQAAMIMAIVEMEDAGSAVDQIIKIILGEDNGTA